jgi:hypothetical protein
MASGIEYDRYSRIHSNTQVPDCMTYIIVLILLIDGRPITAMPISERFDTWVTCSYYAIDAKNQMAIIMKERMGEKYTVEWECKLAE